MTPRSPTPEETAQLVQDLVRQGYQKDDAEGTVAASAVAVFDDYTTGGPGYSGKLMMVVWEAGPETSQVFCFEDGKLVSA